MNLEIAEKVALVMGSSSGLGRAEARELATEGVRVAVSARREHELNSLVAETNEADGIAVAFPCDQSMEGAMKPLVSDVTAKMDAPEIVILNGGGPRLGVFQAMQLEDWDTGYKDTFRNALELVYEVLPAMKSAGWGRIVAMTSKSVKQPMLNIVLARAFRVSSYLL